MKSLKRNLLLLPALALVVFTAACSNSSTDKSASAKEKNEAKTITVATAAMPKPFTYVNEKGELEGYDIEVVKNIDKLLPQYKIQITKTEFAGIFGGIDSGRYQLAANNLTKNKDREAKYLFSDAVFENKYGIVSKKGDLKSLDDIGGKTTVALPGSNYAIAMENYNKKHPENPLKITYSQQDVTKQYQDVDSGKYDFILDQEALFHGYIKNFGFDLQFNNLADNEQSEIGIPYSYLLFGKSKEGEQLQKDFNEALKKLNEDGTLKKLSEKYFEGDYTPKD